MKKIAVVFFPGMNCEVETVRALHRVGFEARTVLWNENPSVLDDFDGAVIPGGFSFEDRGRSGVVSAQEDIILRLKQMADAGKPILGICNGAQVLVEAGLVPDFSGEKKVEMCLARNKRISPEGEVLGTGFYHSWVHIKNTAPKGRCAFNDFDGVLHLPVAHGEGRFTSTPEILEAIRLNQMNVFTYCSENGEIIDSFPETPNGSAFSSAAICNTAGNVLALMPHPERTETCDAIFSSMYNYLNKTPSQITVQKPQESEEIEIPELESQIEFYVTLKITDNTEKTIEKSLRKALSDPKLTLKRQVFWGVSVRGGDPKTIAEQIVASGELFNENKESVAVEIAGDYYRVNNGELVKTDFELPENTFLAIENEDFLGQEKTEHIAHHLGLKELKKIQNGVLWSVESDEDHTYEDIKNTNLFINPVAGHLFMPQ